MTEGDSLIVPGNSGPRLAVDGVADELAALAARGASGVLRVSGEPEDGAGTVVGRLPRDRAYPDIRWTRPDPAVLRQILAELRQLG